jgi:hypothetical protein
MKFSIHFLFFFFILSAFSAFHLKGNDFTQRANMVLDVQLNDTDRTIDVKQTIQYINNSPDTLTEIYIHLWANAWKSNKSAMARQLIERRKYDFHFAPDHERGGYTHLEFSSGGEMLTWTNYYNHEDIAILYPSAPILPGATYTINTQYTLKFPAARFSRLGHVDDNFFATQWYPKPAVYDRHGWHPMPYLETGEFYASFGDYQFTITLPENYTVASSGVLLTKSENERLINLDAKTRKSALAESGVKESPASSSRKKTLHFTQQNIHDFAWFASKNFYVLIDSVPVDGETIQLYTYFTHNALLWQHSNQYLADIIQYMTDKAGPYPWKQVSVVQGYNTGSGAMEYPAITLIGDGYNTDKELEKVIIHEVIHNWFYGILASNERAHAWIDEGFTTYYEFRYLDGKYPDRKMAGTMADTPIASALRISDIPSHQVRDIYYRIKATQHLDQAPGLPAEMFSIANYYTMVYFKTSMALDVLENHVGRNAFDEMIQSFYHRWKFRHPDPDDIRQHFSMAFQDDDISWFFDDLIYSDKKIDLSFKKIRKSPNGYLFSIHNRGTAQVPFPVSAIKNGKVKNTQWFSGHSDEEYFFPGNDYDAFIIDYEKRLPQINRHNNTIFTRRIFKRPILPSFIFMGDIKDHQNPVVYWTPVLGYNANDGLLAGYAFYNYIFPVPATDIFIMPLYSTSRDDWSGTGWIFRDIYPSGTFIHSIRVGSSIKRYGLEGGTRKRSYRQIESSARFSINVPLSSRRKETFIKLTNYLIDREYRAFSAGVAITGKENYYANQFLFFHKDETGVNPWQVNAEVLQANQMIRSSLSVSSSFPYNKLQDGFHIRLFMGKFFIQPEDPRSPDFRFSLQGQNASRTPLYDRYFIGYQHLPGTIAGNQLTETYGYFKFPTPAGLTWEWLAAVNISADLPRTPLRGYIDTGTYHGAGHDIAGTEKFPWVTGIQVTLFDDIVTINIPVFYSRDIGNIARLNNLNDLDQLITYNIRFEKINLLEIRRQLHLHFI